MMLLWLPEYIIVVHRWFTVILRPLPLAIRSLWHPVRWLPCDWVSTRPDQTAARLSLSSVVQGDCDWSEVQRHDVVERTVVWLGLQPEKDWPPVDREVDSSGTQWEPLPSSTQWVYPNGFQSCATTTTGCLQSTCADSGVFLPPSLSHSSFLLASPPPPGFSFSLSPP